MAFFQKILDWLKNTWNTYFERSEKQGSARKAGSYSERSEEQGSARRAGFYIWHKVNPRIGKEFEEERKEMIKSIEKDIPLVFNNL